MSGTGEGGDPPAPQAPPEGTPPREEPSAEPSAEGAGAGPWNGDAAAVPQPDDASPDGDDRKNGTIPEEESLTYDDQTSSYRRDFPKGGSRDVVFGTVNHYYQAGAGQQRRPPGRISVADLWHARLVHVTTPSDAKLRSELQDQHVVFYRGTPDTGRSQSATVVLGQLTGLSRAASKVIVLDAAADLTGTLGQLEAGCGHLLDGTGTPWIDTLSQGQLNQARVALGDLGYLVIVVDADSVQPRPGPVVPHTPPDLGQVSGFHLAARLAGDAQPDERAQTAARSHARALIEEACQSFPKVAGWQKDIGAAATSCPAEAVLFAEAIWDWHRRRPVDPAAAPPVAEFRDRHRYEQAAGLLRRHDGADSPLRQSYAISAAVMDGLALNEVIDGAGKLSALLAEVEHPGEPGHREVFGQPLARWLRHVQIASADPESSDRGGTVVRMHSRELARVVIELAWRQYDAARTPILAWLMALCERHRDHRVRIRAVQALAFIAAHDYALVKEQVLDAWSAPDSRPVEHLAASWLMEAMVIDGTSTDKVRETLRRWSRSPDRKKRAVAVRAYGTSIASGEPQDALLGVRISAVLPDLGSLPELALVQMYLLDLTKEVTAELTLWMQGFPAMRERAAKVLVLISQVRRGEPGESDRPYDLLWLLAHTPDKVGATLAQIAGLWCLACSHESFRSDAWRMIGRWADCCREHPDLRGTFSGLIDEFEKAATADEIRGRLDVYRRWWNRNLSEENEE